ncbi:MAG TPA: glycosyltransferase family 39 protein [Blastocatellia bacterium]|nr:glycosyltransferase family 39 protein [Blastocatellia bacterium]
MQTVEEVEASETQQGESQPERGIIGALERRKVLVVLVLVLAGFWARVYKTDEVGLCEDETNKIFAVRSYLQGDLTANAEHPMLMKLMCLGSLKAASAWNRLTGNLSRASLSEETALRMPNAIFGALTVIPLFLFAVALFGFRVGLFASVFWSVGVNSVWFNRIGKEDTLLVFFMLLGFYFYNRAKNRPASDAAGEEMDYALSGAAFGLMLASKYFPHYYGLNALYYHLAGYDSRYNRPFTKRTFTTHVAALLLTFVVFNFAAVVPQTWRFNWAFINESLITHHGYLLMDKLYINEMSQTPGGNPWYFYLLFLAVKLPAPLVVAFVLGAIEAFRIRAPRPSARGAVLLRMMIVFWLGPMSFVGAKWSRYILAFLPFVYIAAGLGVDGVWRWLATLVSRLGGAGRIRKTQLLRWSAAAAVVAIFVVGPAVLSLRSLPHASFYVNSLGGGRVGYFFPHDEFYDVGARESIRYIAERAPYGARIASEIPGVLGYYLERYGRPDIRSEIISNPEFDFAKSQPDYMILQKGRLYIENHDEFLMIERNYRPVQESIYDGAVTSQVYDTRPKGDPPHPETFHVAR